MQTITYHAYPDANHNTVLACNRFSDSRPLLVNCAGTTYIKWKFHTRNPYGRKDYYLLYLKKGTLSLLTGQEILTLTDGTLILLPPDSPYEYFQTKNEDLFYYWIHFTGSHVESLLQEFHLSMRQVLRIIPQLSSRIEYQMQKMFDIFIKKDTYRIAELSHCLDAILLELAKNALDFKDKPQRLSNSIKYINMNYTSDLSIPELAAMDFLSVSRYNVLFRSIMNVSPYQYIIHLRLNAACEMLLNSNLNIGQISELAGFQNCFFFSKLFKKHLKVSPLKYRQGILTPGRIDTPKT